MGRSPDDERTVRALPDAAAVPRPWLGSYPPGVPPTYRYADVPVTRFLDDAARDFPAVPATWFDGVTIDYAQLRTQMIRFAAGLRSAGVSAGDRVVVACGELPALPIALFAILRLGAVAVLIDPEADDLADAVVLADAVTVIGDRRVVEVAAAHTGADLVTVRARDWMAPTRRTLVTARRWLADRGLPGRGFMDLLETGVDVPAAGAGPDAPAVIVHERGARLTYTHANLVAGAFQARLWVPDVQAGTERILLGAPSTGSFGLTAGILAGVLSAATLIMPRRRRAGDVLGAAGRARPGLALLEPELATEAAPEAGGLASLRVALVDGPVPGEAVRRFEVLAGARLRAVHASSAAGFALAAPVYGRTGPPGAVLPVTDTLAVVVGEDASRVVGDGEIGRLALHGPQLSPDAVGRDGWMVTSQGAVSHPDGWLQLAPSRPRHHHVAGGAA